MATENEEVEGAEGEEGAATPKSKKGLIIGIVALLVLGGGGAGAYFAFGGKHDETGGKEAKGKVGEKEKLPPTYITHDPPFVVNFEAESAVRFLQVTAQIMTRDIETEKLVKENDPRLRNDLLLILGGQTYASVATTEGKEALRTKCLDATRAIVKDMGGEPAKIEALYFTSFVMQ
jgi:flagellar FliL protein